MKSKFFNALITVLFLFIMLFSACSEKSASYYIEADGQFGFNLRYTGNDGTSAIYISGMKNTLPFDVDKVNYSKVQRLFHPQVYLKGDRGANDVFNGHAQSPVKNIYSPILLQRDYGYDMIFGGWDMDHAFQKTEHGNVDRLFMAKITDNSLTKWQNNEDNNRRMILQSDLYNDPSLYHINDPSVIDLGDGHYRMYFEMESLNSPVSFNGKLKDLKPPKQGELGIPVLGIAMVESFDYG